MLGWVSSTWHCGICDSSDIYQTWQLDSSYVCEYCSMNTGCIEPANFGINSGRRLQGNDGSSASLHPASHSTQTALTRSGTFNLITHNNHQVDAVCSTRLVNVILYWIKQGRQQIYHINLEQKSDTTTGCVLTFFNKFETLNRTAHVDFVDIPSIYMHIVLLGP